MAGSIDLKPVFIVGIIQRLKCKNCGVTPQEKIKYADKKFFIETMNILN